jgi:hypothetical protein
MCVDTYMHQLMLEPMLNDTWSNPIYIHKYIILLHGMHAYIHTHTYMDMLRLMHNGPYTYMHICIHTPAYARILAK